MLFIIVQSPFAFARRARNRTSVTATRFPEATHRSGAGELAIMKNTARNKRGSRCGGVLE